MDYEGLHNRIRLVSTSYVALKLVWEIWLDRVVISSQIVMRSFLKNYIDSLRNFFWASEFLINKSRYVTKYILLLFHTKINCDIHIHILNSLFKICFSKNIYLIKIILTGNISNCFQQITTTLQYK